MNGFEKLLIEQFGEHEPKEIDELILDEFWDKKENFTTEEKTVLEKYRNLVHLSLNKIGLKSLENFPCIKNLHCLSLNDNNLNGEDLDVINKLYPYLHKLKICGNKIEKFDIFEKLENCGSLDKIEVKDNPFINEDNNYKEKLFNKLPKIKAIDKETRDGDEILSTDYHNEEEEYNDINDDNSKKEKGNKNEDSEENEEDNEYNEESDYEDDEEEENESDNYDDEK